MHIKSYVYFTLKGILSRARLCLACAFSSLFSPCFLSQSRVTYIPAPYPSNNIGTNTSYTMVTAQQPCNNQRSSHLIFGPGLWNGRSELLDTNCFLHFLDARVGLYFFIIWQLILLARISYRNAQVYWSYIY